MHEGPPNVENREKITKEQVIESLRQSPTDLTVLNQYMDERRAEIRDSRADLTFNIELGEIYREAGLLDDAYNAFLDAHDQARMEGDDELADKLFAEAEKLVLE